MVTNKFDLFVYSRIIETFIYYEKQYIIVELLGEIKYV